MTDTTHWTLTATAELPPELEDRVIEKISAEQICFRENVLRMETHVTFVKENSASFQLKPKDMYDVQDIQCDILSGMFCHRFVSWLQDEELNISKDSVTIKMTGIGSVEQGGSC